MNTFAKMMLSGVCLLCALGQSSAQSDQSGSDQGLQGTWRVRVTLVNCATGLPTGLPTFTSLVTFASGGTATGTTSNPALQPGQRTSEHGIWRENDDSSYTSVREAFILFSTAPNPPVPGFPKGTQRITEAIQVKGDQSAHLARIQFFDVNGNQVAAGCAQATGQRFK